MHFAGFQHDVVSWMNAMDVVVHGSTQPEPFGFLIIEAMAAGRPVIASNGGAVPEIPRDRENRLIVEPANAPKLANAISTLQRDPELAARLAATRSCRCRHELLHRTISAPDDACAFRHRSTGV